MMNTTKGFGKCRWGLHWDFQDEQMFTKQKSWGEFIQAEEISYVKTVVEEYSVFREK